MNKQQYLNGYYYGEISRDSATVYVGPGTKAYPALKTDDGTVVTLKKGDKVTVWGETKDLDLDIWYHITATFKGKEIEGYIYSGRVKRNDTMIPFTPTLTPGTNTPTPSGKPSDTPTPTPKGGNGDIQLPIIPLTFMYSYEGRV